MKKKNLNKISEKIYSSPSELLTDVSNLLIINKSEVRKYKNLGTRRRNN